MRQKSSIGASAATGLEVDEGSGEDFDDFKQGAEAAADDVFGDFDDGFQDAAVIEDAPAPAEVPIQETSLPPFVSSRRQLSVFMLNVYHPWLS